MGQTSQHSTAAVLKVTRTPYMYILSGNSTETATYTAQLIPCSAVQLLSSKTATCMPDVHWKTKTQGRTDPNQNTGISIHNCTIKLDDDLVSSNYSVQTYLGRPWKQYSRTVYMQSFMGSLIESAGWKEWSGDFALNTSYYTEFNNTGPGSSTTGRITWAGYHVINDIETAKNFIVSKFIHGKAWLPATVPFESGLLHNWIAWLMTLLIISISFCCDFIFGHWFWVLIIVVFVYTIQYTLFFLRIHIKLYYLYFR